MAIGCQPSCAPFRLEGRDCAPGPACLVWIRRGRRVRAWAPSWTFEPADAVRAVLLPDLAAGCDCGFDVIEESLKYQVMKRPDPLMPDHLVAPGRVALDGVANNRRAVGHLQLKPVLALQLIRADDPERPLGTRAIELFPEHQPGIEQAVPLRTGNRSDLSRPDTVEVRDKYSDPLRRCRDNPFVEFPDLHSPLTLPAGYYDKHKRFTGRSPRPWKRSFRAATANQHLPRATPSEPPIDSDGCFPPRTRSIPPSFFSPCCRSRNEVGAPSHDTAALGLSSPCAPSTRAGR